MIPGMTVCIAESEREITMSVLVSIIIPVFNTQKEYFEPCIKSVLGQTYPDFEVLLIDDGSKKECADFLELWAQADKRIRLYHIENAGVSHARNYALEHAAGKYILFVDSDDLINQTWLSWAVCKAEEEQADAVFGGVKGVPRAQSIDTDKPVTGEYCLIQEDEMWKIQCGQLIRGLKKNDPRFEVVKHGVWGRLIRREIIGLVRFIEGMYYGEDQVFNHSVICKMKKAIYNMDECYYLLEDRPGSATNTYDPRRIDVIHEYLYHLKECLIENSEVYNAYQLHVLSLVDNHIDHTKKTRTNRKMRMPEMYRSLKDAMSRPLFKEAMKQSDLSALRINKSFVKLWLAKHGAAAMIAIWVSIKQISGGIQKT